jgi:hypothetical protein
MMTQISDAPVQNQTRAQPILTTVFIIFLCPPRNLNAITVPLNIIQPVPLKPFQFTLQDNHVICFKAENDNILYTVLNLLVPKDDQSTYSVRCLPRTCKIIGSHLNLRPCGGYTGHFLPAPEG